MQKLDALAQRASRTICVFLLIAGIDFAACEREVVYPAGLKWEEATALDADLVVMGGYAHSRLRELVFGGATRELLRSANVPLLMAH